MKKTPLSQLIQFMEQNQYFIGNDLYAKQKELLEQEKQMVIDAFDNGAQELDDWYSYPSGGTKTSEQYFNETFEQ